MALYSVKFDGKTYIPSAEYVLENLQKMYNDKVTFSIERNELTADVPDDIDDETFDRFELGVDMQRCMTKPYGNGCYHISL